ncbi:MAG: sulfatase-like hydrolase/transferase [Candidatus Hydrogenedentes bacterium]|nr:sulfatase-like hydrolase/transferase [Candidatus Hydrogenedentota bacterium]
MERESPRYALADTVCVALQYAMGFVCLETCLSAQPDSLIAYPANAVRAPLAGLAIYGALLFVLTGLGAILLRTRWKTARPAHVPVAGAAVAFLVGTAFVCYAPEVSFRLAGAVGGSIGVVAALSLLARRIPWLPGRFHSLAWAAAFLSGALTLVAADSLLYVHPHRWALSLALAAGSITLTQLVATAAAACLRRRGAAVFQTAATLLAAAIAPAGLVAFPAVARERGAENAPSVLLVSGDALRADYCSVYGGQVPTPALEALAARGILFERSYALAPWTLPSLNGMFTSKYPPGFNPGGKEAQVARPHTYTMIPAYWKEGEGLSFPKRAEARGYVTGAFVGNPLMNQPWLLGEFNVARVMEAHPRDRSALFSRLPLLRGALMWVAQSVVHEPPLDITRWVSCYARQFLRDNRGRPFLLWVHFLDPHSPYTPPEPYHVNGYDEYWSLAPQMGVELFGFMADGLTPDDKRRIQTLYEDEIRYLDDAVGRLVAEVDALGIADTTYIWFTADHGEEFWDHDEWSHGQSLYEELVRIPLIATGPGIGPRVVPEPVSMIDAIPTLAELLGAEPSPAWRGRSLAPLLFGDVSAPPAQPCYSQGTVGSFFAQARAAMVGRMTVSGDYKLIRDLDTGQEELYDLRQDPGETQNLRDSRDALARDLGHGLDEWVSSFPATFKDLDKGVIVDTPTDEMVEAFRAMGYMN